MIRRDAREGSARRSTPQTPTYLRRLEKSFRSPVMDAQLYDKHGSRKLGIEFNGPAHRSHQSTTIVQASTQPLRVRTAGHVATEPVRKHKVLLISRDARPI